MASTPPPSSSPPAAAPSCPPAIPSSVPFVHPVLFLSHGGGPSWFMNAPSPSHFLYGMDAASPARAHMAALFDRLYPPDGPPRPSALVVVSAHWEGPSPGAVETLATDHLFFDYYGFPPETYTVRYDCPTDPALASSIATTLREAGITAEVHSGRRGWDHGVFIPLAVVAPAASIPVVQVSLVGGLGAAAHLRLGEALAPLRAAGVLLVASGQSTHNLRELMGRGEGEGGDGEGSVLPWAARFQAWLDDTVTGTVGGLPPEGQQGEARDGAGWDMDAETNRRRAALVGWTAAPDARSAHPREEHLMPLLVAAGAAGGGRGEKLWGGWAAGHMSLASYLWW